MRRRTLLSQVILANLVIISAAVVAASLAADFDFSIGDQRNSLAILLMAIALTVAVNIWLLQRRFAPLERVIQDMEKVDLSRPRSKLPPTLDGRGEIEEVERIELAFLRMLDRLEAERRRTSSAALRAQEEERSRVARELHDEVNQALTGVLLHLEAARGKAPAELQGELAETKALANQAMEELLSLARQLRPTALDDLGLKAAVAGHVRDYGMHTGIDASFEATGDLADLPDDVQLVIYRVVQESLSNAAQHAGASSVAVRLSCSGDQVELAVADDGRGFSFDDADRGLGLTGMRERALLVGGELAVESRPGRGTMIRLTAPVESVRAPATR